MPSQLEAQKMVVATGEPSHTNSTSYHHTDEQFKCVGCYSSMLALTAHVEHVQIVVIRLTGAHSDKIECSLREFVICHAVHP